MKTSPRQPRGRRPLCCLFLLAPLWASAAPAPAAKPRNIVLIYADDLGWGDLSCYGATRVKTPHLDRLAAQGLRFTDAHSPSATCTPSRYAMLTGEYAWRRRGTGVLPGDAKLIIEPGRPTLASMLREAGYTTAVVGKWHLGLGPGPGLTDWNGEVKPGPLEVGFDYCFVMPATGDRVPCVYVEDHRVVGLDPKDPIRVRFDKPLGDEPTGKSHPELLKVRPSHGHDMTVVNGISRIGYMSGGKAARWKDEDMADDFTRQAVAFIERNRSRPFFLYFSTHDVHVPRVPHPRFAGRTDMGPRGDAIVELDWCAGEILAAIERHGLTEDTLVIVSSDNGPVVDDGYKDDAAERLGGHKPAGLWRGGKYSNFEGGTRVPFIVRWPRRVKPGVSSALLCHVDLMASFAAFTGRTLPANAAPDSSNVLPALLGESNAGRDHLVEHASVLSLRRGPWKLIPAGKGPKLNRNTNSETGNDPQPQLYDLASDPGETRNVTAEHPEKVRELTELLEKIQGP
jgi:arylsulfatase A-like enzyme